MTTTPRKHPLSPGLTTIPPAGTLVARNYDGWSAELRDEFIRFSHDGHVGSRLLFETDRVRAWELRLAPGQRWHPHRHVLDYFWIASTSGRSCQHTADGTTREVTYTGGDSKYFTFGAGEYLLHDLHNIGDDELVFLTVEHLDSANAALPITVTPSRTHRTIVAPHDRPLFTESE